MTGVLAPTTPEAMLERAIALLDGGVSSQAMLAEAAHQVESYTTLATIDAGHVRVTGETFAATLERWETYRGLLLDHLRGPDGGGA